jgi:hypothetical protein
MNKKSIFFYIFLIVLFTTSVFAKPTPTPSSEPTPTPESATSDIREVIRQEVQKRLSQNSSQPQNPVIVGTIISIQSTGLLLTISTTRQSDKVASVSAKTIIIRLSPSGERKQVKFNDAAVGDSTIVLGTPNADGSMIAKRLTLFTSTPPKRLVYLGNITTKSTNSVTIKLAKSDTKISFSAGSTSTIQKPDGSKLALASLKEGDLVIVAGTQTDDKTPVADLIVRLSSAAKPTPTPKP